MQIKVVPISIDQRFNNFEVENHPNASACSNTGIRDLSIALASICLIVVVALAYNQYNEYHSRRKEVYL